MPSQWEKVTSFGPRRSWPKGWWAALACVAVLFFLLGGGVTMWTVSIKSLPVTALPSSKSPEFLPKSPVLLLMENLKFVGIAQNDIAAALRLTPQQISTQLSQGKPMSAIAQAQGVSTSDLQNIELKAMQHMFDAEVNAGSIDKQQADQTMQQLQNEPPLLEKVIMIVFTASPDGNSSATPKQ
jgi:hypothetical protein